jgi:hypothetical protein
MKKLTLGIFAAALAAFAGAASSTLVNGGFETGDLTGWTASTPGGSASAVNSGAGGITPVEGSWMGEVVAGNADTNQTLSQTFNMDVGDILTGWANFFNAENTNSFFNDVGFVDLIDPLAVVHNLFFADTTTTPGSSALGWTPISYQATTAGAHTVVAGVRNVNDPIASSSTYVDGLTVPAPASLALVALGLAGLGFGRRRRDRA